ncbi:protein DpdH [Akkermansiaceae bacterium]|nr:protein DpdH [Akkermansiaceae bacterium]
MSLLDFWPPTDPDHADSCIFTEAETAPDAVFLAVHQPMTLMRKNYQSDEEAVDQTEVQILEEFIRDNPSSGTVVMPIIGDSAVGKSHMIRWIDAHMRMHGLAENRHIVRIPKSASMKTVLSMILDDLEGDDYEQLREDLRQARLPVDSYQASLDLRSNLTGALGRLITALRTRANSEPLGAKDQRRLSHAGGMRSLLNDPAISDYLLHQESGENERDTALSRIVSPLLHDTHDVDNERENQFYTQDLDFVHQVEVADLAAPSRPYFSRLLRNSERDAAVELLNELLDEALNGLIDFSGDSLPDLFKKVRAGLLGQGKELILLIEDFAMLGGVQQQLLDAVTDSALGAQGERNYCVMRTAIAVTEGRLDEATVLTRAGASWKIRSRPFSGEEEALNVFTNMVGGYLNAARHGVTELRLQLEASAGKEIKFTNYLDDHGGDLTEEEMNRLESFGYSPCCKYPLFPFNQNAIRQIMERNLKQKGEYQFKPRSLNRVVRDTVMNYRDLWQKEQFPPPQYQHFKRNKLGPEVSQHLNQSSNPESTAALLGFWGDCPDTLEAAAALPTAVYETFGMQTIDWGNIVPSPPTTVSPSESDQRIRQNKLASTKSSQESKRIEKWLDCLKTWRQDGTIGQTEARLLRNMIAEAIKSMIDLDPLMLRDIDIGALKIYLPYARTGNPADTADFSISTATEDELKDSNVMDRFFLAIESVVRFHESKNWEFNGAENHYSRYVNFIERLTTQVDERMRDFGANTLPKEGITPLVHSLMIGARILNLNKASSSNYGDMMEVLFDPGLPPDDTPRGQTTRWEDLAHAAATSRDEMRHLLLLHVAARQGGAKGEHAVDASMLIPALETLRKQDWQLLNWENEGWRSGMTRAKEHTTRLRTQLNSILEEQSRTATEWADKVAELFGEAFNMDEIAETLRDTINRAVKCGAFRNREGSDPKAFRGLINAVKKLPVKSCFDEARSATGNEGEFGKSLSAIGKLDLFTISRTEELIDAIDRFLSDTDRKAEADLVDAPHPEEAANRLITQLETTRANWGSITTRISS